MIDWDVALKTAERLVPPGPALSAAEVDDVVADLRAAAAEAEQPVRTFTGLSSQLRGDQSWSSIARVGWKRTWRRHACSWSR